MIALLALFDFPGEGMLASTITDDENIHNRQR
jgi:hypothetical protein